MRNEVLILTTRLKDRAGLTLRDVADALGVTEKTLSRGRAGKKIKMRTVLALRRLDAEQVKASRAEAKR